MAQSIFIKKTFGYLSKIDLSSLWGKSETRKNRQTEPVQPFLPCLPNTIVQHNFPLVAISTYKSKRKVNDETNVSGYTLHGHTPVLASGGRELRPGWRKVA